MKIRPLAKGLLTYVPGSQHFLPKHTTGGTNSARYCYGVWMKHLTLLHEQGVTGLPETVAELGPGDSLGIGLAAMLSGSNRYYALDVLPFANVESNLKIFDELVELYLNRVACPTGGFPEFQMYLDEDLFPSHILTDNMLSESLSNDRLEAIRRALQAVGTTVDNITIEYLVPWSDEAVLQPGSVDLVISHSVLEHVVDLEATYRALKRWLKPGGMMSHQIDFTSHGLSDEWNGYRGYPDWLWKAIVGKRDYLLNRAPHSVHRRLVLNNGFDLLCDLEKIRSDGIPRSKHARRWQDISEDDLKCSGAFMQSRLH